MDPSFAEDVAERDGRADNRPWPAATAAAQAEGRCAFCNRFLPAPVACLDCNGLGARSAIAGHCFDIDGGLWHVPGECTAPEHPSGSCCPPCTTCQGTGRVADPCVCAADGNGLYEGEWE